MKIYALYRGEDYIWSGTLEEIAEKTGKSLNSIKFMTYPAHKKRIKNSAKRLEIFEIEDFEEEDFGA